MAFLHEERLNIPLHSSRCWLMSLEDWDCTTEGEKRSQMTLGNVFQGAMSCDCIYLSLRLLHLQVWRVGQQVSGQLHGQPTSLVTVAVSMEGLGTRKQHLHAHTHTHKHRSAWGTHLCWVCRFFCLMSGVNTSVPTELQPAKCSIQRCLIIKTMIESKLCFVNEMKRN